MKTIRLNTGVEIDLDDDGNMINVRSPYIKTKPFKTTVLRYYVNQIKKIIS
jgi:hypothetical protein